MSTTLTVRLDDDLREALQRRAAAQGKTVSGFLREILAAALEERPIGARTRDLRGQLELPADDTDPWRQQLKERNWRP